MKLSLDANLLLKTYAGGGYADNVYKYDKTNEYLKHSVLIGMTLAEKTNQRKMEMEPVSRHLGVNIISDFRFRSIMLYIKNYNIVNGAK